MTIESLSYHNLFGPVKQNLGGC